MSEAPTTHEAAVEEVKRWLAMGHLEAFTQLVLDNGYDDLDAISKSTEEEQLELEQLFSQPNRDSIHYLNTKLKEIGINGFRKSGIPPKEPAHVKPLISIHPRFPSDTASASSTSSASAASPRVVSPRKITFRSTENGEEAPAESPDTQQLFAKGYLSIHNPTEFGVDWADRFCMVDDGKLCWYKSRREAAPEGGMEISKVTHFEQKSDLGVLVMLEDKTYEFVAPSVKDFGEWKKIFDAMHRAADVNKPKRATPASPRRPDPADDSHPAPVKSESKGSVQAPLVRSETSHLTLEEKRDKRFQTMLMDGAMFKKYKKGSSNKRFIWCNPTLDRVIWSGNEEEKYDVKGFLKVSEFVDIHKGDGKVKNRIFVVSISQTLELEAKDGSMQNEWLQGFRYLLKRQEQLEEQYVQMKDDPAQFNEFQRQRKEYTELLTTGDVFKKYKKNSCTTRTIWFSPNLDRVYWGEEKGKSKGDVQFKDMCFVSDVDVESKSSAPLRFTIIAEERNLVLEARDEDQKRKWIDAVRYILRYSDKFNASN